MAERAIADSDAPARRIGPIAKVVYVLAVTIGTLAVPSWLRPWAVPSLLLVQVVLLVTIRAPGRAVVRGTRRLWGVFLVLIVCQTFLPAPAGDLVLRPVLGTFRFSPGINLTGLAESLLMCGQIMTVILASMVVRHSGPETDLVDGLRRLGCPRLLACSIDNTLALLGGNSRGDEDSQRGRGPGKGKRRGRRNAWQDGRGAGGIGGLWMKARGLVRGDLGWFVVPIRSAIDRASQRVGEGISPGHHDDRKFAHDAAVISGVGLVMMSMRMLKVLPGIPFASGLQERRARAALHPGRRPHSQPIRGDHGRDGHGPGRLPPRRRAIRRPGHPSARRARTGHRRDLAAGSPPASTSLDLLAPRSRGGGVSGFHRVRPCVRSGGSLGSLPVPCGQSDVEPGCRCPERRDYLWLAFSLPPPRAVRSRILPTNGSPGR